jgi:hypothetical protein
MAVTAHGGALQARQRGQECNEDSARKAQRGEWAGMLLAIQPSSTTRPHWTESLPDLTCPGLPGPLRADDGQWSAAFQKRWRFQGVRATPPPVPVRVSETQSLSRATVELGGDGVQRGLVEVAQVAAAGEVLAKQAVGVLVGATLTRAGDSRDQLAGGGAVGRCGRCLGTRTGRRTSDRHGQTEPP